MAAQIRPNEPQQAKVDATFGQIHQATNPSPAWPLGLAIQALASKSFEGSTQAALDRILKQFDDSGAPDVFLQALAQALTALAPKLTEMQSDQAVDPILKQIEWASSDVLLTFAGALQALAPKLTDARAGQAVDSIITAIPGESSSVTLQALAQALTSLAPKLAEAKAQEVSDGVGASLAWAASEDEAADWGRALVALLDRPVIQRGHRNWSPRSPIPVRQERRRTFCSARPERS
jgi:hypothetical protein